MKDTIKNSPVLQKWFDTQSPLVITRPALRETLYCLGYLFGGFLLACGKLSGQPAPLALGFLSAAGGGIRGLCALIGAAGGFLTMQSFSQGLELTSAALLIFVTRYIFGSLWVTKRPWFLCLVPGIMRAAVGAIFLLSQNLTPMLLAGYGENVLLAALSPLAFSALLQGKRKSLGVFVSAAFFLIGAACFPLPVSLNLGLMGGAALSALGTRRGAAGSACVPGALAGLALDAALQGGGQWTLILTAGAVAGSAAPGRHPLLRTGLFGAGAGAAAAYLGGLSTAQWISLGLGLLLSPLLPGGAIAGREESEVQQSAALTEERLSYGQAALKAMYEAIGIDPEDRAHRERQKIFDRAAVKVCRQCAQYGSCWEKNSQQTYQYLSGALETITGRGEAWREDFPEEFTSECRHMEGFLVALNQELAEIQYRGQRRSRREEARIIAARTYLHMSAMLEENARQLRRARRIPPDAYDVKVGAAAKGRRGSKISGDRGVCFHTGDGRFLAILSDGMGTGPEAAQESLTAVNTLSALIQAGLGPEAAMELLNGMYILRDSGCFATMDILELSLVTGQGTLYKWGAAPSYLKTGNLIKKLGTAAPPPGLSAGSTSGAEVIRLSLWGGDMLILVSDGALQERTEELLRGYDGGNVKELAAQLVRQAEDTGGEDDMTAAVLRLEELKP